MTLLWQIGAVAAGGALGAVARYGVYAGVTLAGRTGFPAATLLVNVIGSFVAGMLLVLYSQLLTQQPGWRLFTVVGFLGAFTTFSAFSVETIVLLESGHWRAAAANVVLNLGLCLGACMLGVIVARALWR